METENQLQFIEKILETYKKTERDIIEAKRAENDRIRIQEESNITNRNLKPLTEEQKIIKEKNKERCTLEGKKQYFQVYLKKFPVVVF